MAFSLFGLWSSKNIQPQPGPMPARSIASLDCNGLVKQMISRNVSSQLVVVPEEEKLFKLKNNIWNRIISTKDFDHFDDREYFRWLEIYKDPSPDFSKLNPVTIEQKMALIEVINARLLPTKYYSEKSLTAEAQNLNAMKLKKLQRHLNGLDLSSKLTRTHLDDFASDLMIILKGPPVSLLDYFTKDKSKRMQERLMRMVQEDMLLMGLKGQVERIPEKTYYNRLEEGKHLTKKFFQYKIWKYFVLPYDLPWLERVRIPDELMEKIMIDGLEAHNTELIALLKDQNMIDHYERLRKAWKPMAFSLGFAFYYYRFNSDENAINENQEEEKKKLTLDFEKIAASLNDTDGSFHKSVDELKNQQFERVKATFKEKNNGQEPTPEEIAEMKAMIFK